MAQVVAITEQMTTLKQVEQRFGLERTTDPQFFTEWFADLPDLTEQERSILDRLKHRYAYYRADAQLSEGAVNWVIVSPLLDLAGLCDPPFKLCVESPVEIAFPAEEAVLRGRIDALVIQDQFWVLVVESKRTELNHEIAIPQALAYMAASPNIDRPTFGMVTNGGEFSFLKLSHHGDRQYDLSGVFSLLPLRNELYGVLQILKRIGRIVQE